MSDRPGVVGQSVVGTKDVREFFRELLTSAQQHQRIKVHEETEFYLVNLLDTFLSTDSLYEPSPDGTMSREPLTVLFARALAEPKERKVQTLRKLGDTSLFVSGFFSDSLSRSLVDVNYYVSMGGRAYGHLQSMLGDVRFAELAQKFDRIVDLLSEVSERTHVTSNRGLLRLYERYVRTGSEHLADLLVDKGVLPKSVGKKWFMQ